MKKNLVQIFELREALSDMEGNPASRIVSTLDSFSPSSIYIAWLLARKAHKAILNSYMVNWKHVKAITTGWDLQQRGVSKGPLFKSILNRLRSAWLDGELNTSQEELILLDNILDSKDSL